MNSIDRRLLLRTAIAGMAARAFPANAQQSATRLRLTLGSQALAVRLVDNPSTRDLLTLLPLDLTAKDFMSNEKLAYLPRKLTTQGAPPSITPVAGEFCYYAPWGNLALFHADGEPSPGLVMLGRFEGPVDALRVKGEVALRVARAT